MAKRSQEWETKEDHARNARWIEENILVGRVDWLEGLEGVQRKVEMGPKYSTSD